MPLVLAGAGLEVVVVAFAAMLLIFAAWWFGTAIGQVVAPPMRRIPVVGDAVADWLIDRITDGTTAIYNTLIKWWDWATAPFNAMINYVANGSRTTAYWQLNMQRQIVNAIVSLWYNTVGTVAPGTSTYIGDTISSVEQQLRGEIVAAENTAITQSNAYTYSIGQWAYNGFLSENGAISTLDLALTQVATAIEGEIAQVRQTALDVAGQAASVALMSANQYTAEIYRNLDSRIQFMDSSIRGAITDVEQTAHAEVATLSNNFNEFTIEMTNFLTVHAIPVVTEIEKVGFECLDNLCGGLGDIAKEALSLTDLLETGAIFGLIYAAANAPEETAKMFANEAQEFIDIGVDVAHAFIGI